MSQELSYDAGDAEAFAAGSRKLRSRFLLPAALALAVLGLAVLPPLIKMNRYGRRIALSMSQSLGRPVHLDSVSLGLLPVPHLTLQNVVVSEDPAFGNEPIIRANVVEASLRVSSLWRRPMEFSRVRFEEPSVNLVRNAEGRWNLEGVLVHASQVDTAPTVQRHVGSAPRFPYIEATGGRVNVKIGDEKKPFSLIDADFALWLPSPEQWSVRLTGTPARTDVNLNDSGILRLEGSLQRAARMPEVPVFLQVTWHNAPLGEATRLLTGEDQGWRGTVQVDTAIRGSLGAGRLETDVTLDDLRRADFVPARTLSLHLHCAALADLPTATLRNAACSLPVGAPEPLRLQAEAVDLARPLAGGATVQAEAVPVEWFASLARLVSARFPATPVVPGAVSANLNMEAPVLAGAAPVAGVASTEASKAGWSGNISLDLPTPHGPSDAGGLNAAPDANVTPPTQKVVADVAPGADGEAWRITLPPTPVRLPQSSTLSFSGTVTPSGYSVRAVGQAGPAMLLAIARKLPPLGDGLAAALGPSTSDTPVRLDVTCSRAWNAALGDQTCTRAPETLRRPVGRVRP